MLVLVYLSIFLSSSDLESSEPENMTEKQEKQVIIRASHLVKRGVGILV